MWPIHRYAVDHSDCGVILRLYHVLQPWYSVRKTIPTLLCGTQHDSLYMSDPGLVPVIMLRYIMKQFRSFCAYLIMPGLHRSGGGKLDVVLPAKTYPVGFIRRCPLSRSRSTRVKLFAQLAVTPLSTMIQCAWVTPPSTGARATVPTLAARIACVRTGGRE